MNRSELSSYLKSIQQTICQTFETLEPKHRFIKKKWDYEKGKGGGTMCVLRGDVFEKAAVNFSSVSGENFPLNGKEGPFYATGVSLITHMQNPHMPTVHMNVRYIETTQESWFGGGYDLTPMGFEKKEDTLHFHKVAKRSLDQVQPGIYENFYENAKQYFYIPHRKKERGVGGIFFDHYNTGDQKHDSFVFRQVAENFLDAIMPIYKKNLSLPYSKQDKALQQVQRAHYVEFNLIYDRGTKFGFSSGGNPEAILCSMPPVATW